MTVPIDQLAIQEVFAKVRAHRLMADLVRRYSTNRDDVRTVALAGLDLGQCRNILDLGCGFGFFTEALQHRVPAQAIVTGVDLIGDNRGAFLDTCSTAGLTGKFLAGGVSNLDNFRDREFDLILCSYALYFFAEAIPLISRLLASSGVFVVITHDPDNMGEMVSVIQEIVNRHQRREPTRLLLEDIVARFSSENGGQLLRPWFAAVATKEFRNALIFGPADRSQILDYFLFKGPLLLSSTGLGTEQATQLLVQQFSQPSFLQHGFTISKNDRIFVCTSPRNEQARR